VLKFLLRLYQWTLSPLLAFIAGPGCGCRFEPRCSEYGIQALEAHGPWRGSGLTLRRLLRCHPWGGFGCDPVPPATAPRMKAGEGFFHSKLETRNSKI
ncbi:MAG TPA: membrane protein insertion efficiency factor YidD, partial [Chthoniobacterales bacterium]